MEASNLNKKEGNNEMWRRRSRCLAVRPVNRLTEWHEPVRTRQKPRTEKRRGPALASAEPHSGRSSHPSSFGHRKFFYFFFLNKNSVLIFSFSFLKKIIQLRRIFLKKLISWFQSCRSNGDNNNNNKVIIQMNGDGGFTKNQKNSKRISSIRSFT